MRIGTLFSGTCRKQILESLPAPCPVCGRVDMQVHIWKDGILQCSYADIKKKGLNESLPRI